MVIGDDNMFEWFSISELAEKSGIAESTVRRYLNNFNVFFRDKGGKRSKKYEANSINILNRIRELFEQGKESEEVRHILSREYSMIIDGDSEVVTDENQERNVDLPALKTSEDTVVIRELLEEQRDFNKMLLDLLQKQETRIQQLTDEVAATKENIGITEEVVQKEPEKKSFIQRLFK